METAGSTMENQSVGARLSQARQAAGMSVSDVSQRIKLTARQIDILENDGFDELGLVFSRGFVRNYARLLGLDANALVQEMPGTARSKSGTISIHDEHIPLTTGLSRYWLIIGAVVIALFVFVPLAIYHWLSGDDIHLKGILPGASAVSKPVAVKPSATAPVASALTPAAPQPSAADAATTRQATSPTGDAPAPARTASATANAAPAQLSFQFAQDSWVEVRDASHHVVLSHLYHAGETAAITAAPPVSLIIGNAANVKLSYNGHSVDITPHAPATAAKLTLP